ncbi:MAG: type I 3-dehydroquinate dehydratase [Acidobacteria bacterium]|nr:type I 3-dehydroquinate dehydratase [Acidobacteriota bacterium]
MRICVTVTADRMSDLRRRRDEAARAGADLVELRLDGVGDLDVPGALEGRTGPVIVACHPAWEGGRFGGSEEERVRILTQALALGADLVDIEWQADLAKVLDARMLGRVVLSHHTFDGLPADLRERALAMQAIGARVVKVAVTPRSLRDLLRLRQSGCVLEDGRKVLLAMGVVGWSTRLLPWRFGSAWTYAGGVSAVGQLSPSEMVEEFRCREVTRDAELYGVVGSPIAHSMSPVMHNAAFRALNRDAIYVPLESGDADDLLEFAKEMRFAGLSVTAPLKVPLFERADQVDELSEGVGACNTLRFREGRVEATNTDVAGFLAPLERRGIRLEGLRAALVGAGGASRGVAFALGSRGARVTIHARRPEQARQTATATGASCGPWPPQSGSWDLLVNATPVGTVPRSEETPFLGPFEGAIVYDLVYNPPRSRLLREAAGAGCQTIDGLEMLVAQACLQLEWWTGARAPEAAMRAAVERKLDLRADGAGSQKLRAES